MKEIRKSADTEAEFNMSEYEQKKLASGRPKMTVADRAKQFAPFAALTGLPEMLAKKEKTVVDKPDLSEDALAELDQKMHSIQKGMLIDVICYQKGECIKISGMVAKIEHTSRILQIVNNRISFDDILDVNLDGV